MHQKYLKDIVIAIIFIEKNWDWMVNLPNFQKNMFSFRDDPIRFDIFFEIALYLPNSNQTYEPKCLLQHLESETPTWQQECPQKIQILRVGTRNKKYTISLQSFTILSKSLSFFFFFVLGLNIIGKCPSQII